MILFERHLNGWRDRKGLSESWPGNSPCSCSYCKGSSLRPEGMRYGLNIPKSKTWNSWWVIKIWPYTYFRFTLPFLKRLSKKSFMKTIILSQNPTVNEISETLSIKVTDFISTAMSLGYFPCMNDRLPKEQLEEILFKLNCTIDWQNTETLKVTEKKVWDGTFVSYSTKEDE